MTNQTETLRAGDLAPPFSLPSDNGELVSLSDFAGRKLVIFFYPKANTPGCTTEAIDFTRLREAFTESGTAVIGVSADSVRKQCSFVQKHSLGIPLLSDENCDMLRTYGVWGPKMMYGKTFDGITRTTILIGPDGRIQRIWSKVKVAGHADEVLLETRQI